MSDLIARTLGPYRIVEQAGAGGMATVYKAYHAAMDRYVAIKVLPRHLAHNPSFRARFQREARTIARLQHRSILPVHDVAEDDGVHYLVMRYVDGGTLADLIAAGTLTIERALRIVGQVGEALAYAHRQGVIHRDVKPANVLIEHDGGALLTDFGIAKIFEETLQLTSQGTLIGTPAYMAPEQFQDQPVDARADIYALGVMLYQALTGQCPFVAEAPLAVGMMHIHDSPRPPRQLNPAIPKSIEGIVLRAMAKSPAGRFQTANELVEALERAAALDLSRRPNLSDRLYRATRPTQQARAPQPSAGAAGPPTERATHLETPLPTDGSAAGRRLGGRRLWIALGGAAVFLMLLGIIGMNWLQASAPQSRAGQPTPSTSPPLRAMEPAIAAATTLPATAEQPSPTKRPTAAPPPTDAPSPTGIPTSAPSVSPQPTVAPPDALVSSDQLSLRSGPGQQFAALGTYREGTALTVTGRDPGGTWLRVRTPEGQTGWMLREFLLVNVALQDVVVVAPTSRPPTQVPPTATRPPPTRPPPTRPPPTQPPPAPPTQTPDPPTQAPVPEPPTQAPEPPEDTPEPPEPEPPEPPPEPTEPPDPPRPTEPN